MFGAFVLDPERARLMRDGEEIKLRPKSFELLRYMIEHPARVITKEDLIKAIWPDAFVTDDSLVQCVRDIRRALQDDGQQYVKTLPRRGYLFEASVSMSSATEISTSHSPAEETAFVETAEEITEPRKIGRLRQTRTSLSRIGIGVLLLALSSLILWYPSTSSLRREWSSTPLTTYPGEELNPALSPDSKAVAFTWNGQAQDNFDIYVQPIDSVRPQRLTTDPAEDTSPAWSPDGRTIAFLRRTDGERNHIILIPAEGGPEHVLAEIRQPFFGGSPSSTLRKNLAWTVDGHWIAAPHNDRDDSPRGLLLVSGSTGDKRVLTEPPAGYFDENPAFSPDGLNLVFARRPGTGGSDLYLQPLSKDFLAVGQPTRLTNNGRASHPVWTRDGRILFVGRDSLRVMTSSTRGVSESVQIDGRISDMSLGQHLVYSQLDFDPNIWRAEIPSSNDPPATPTLLISSTHADNSARYSPNGKQIAFRSSRSGTSQLWISSADGSNPIRLTSFDAAVLLPSWSPDGQWIVFHSRLGQAGADLFRISAAGGSPQRLTTDPSDDVTASYSRDGLWLYFASTRSGQFDIWKMPAAGGEATRLTRGGGLMPLESPDGNTIFYANLNPGKGIWKVSAQGGDAVQVTGPVAKDAAFAVSKEGIYYAVPRESSGRQLIEFRSFSTGKSRSVVVTQREIGFSMSLSEDGRYLIFPQRDRVDHDLMLIKDFISPR
jgi:Tol biopolymer transport system component/DNA-binding winged helix-turn-helix (wHTH) protein